MYLALPRTKVWGVPTPTSSRLPAEPGIHLVPVENPVLFPRTLELGGQLEHNYIPGLLDCLWGPVS